MFGNNSYSKQKEWQHKLGITVAGMMAFETLTGLSIYFLPFSIANQIQVILHTGIGLIFILPFLIYSLRHWMIYRPLAFNHYKFTGYVMLLVMMVLILSGVILTYESIFLTKISRLWDKVHVITTFILIALFIPHVIFNIIQYRQKNRTELIKNIINAEKSWARKTLASAVIFYAVVAIWAVVYSPVSWKNEFPKDYSFLYGDERPFAPSLATTVTGGAYDPESIGNSEGCGTSGCHEEIYKEWEVSAHRYAAMDVAFQTIQGVMGQQNGPESTRYCGGCHDPISLFSGNKNIYTDKDDLTNIHGYQEGISCIACHSIKETDIKGNANYKIDQPNRYMYELKEGEVAKVISDFLIRSYPEYHIESFQHKMFKSPEFCAACHKQFIDEEVNNVGWVQLQNQYDKWRKSKWNHPGDPTKTIECRECHMPLISNLNEPSAGDDLDYNRTPDDGKFRSHRFLGANQFMPAVLDLERAEEHVELTKKWLRGEIEIPEIEEKWTKGPAVPIELVVPDQVNPGEEMKIQTILTNNKPGHDFPTGPIDIIQSWVEITVTDQAGNLVYKSGHTDEDHFIQPGSFVFKVEPVDQYGNLIDKHNLWEMVGVRFNRSMFPGFTDQAEFTFDCPGSISKTMSEKEKINDHTIALEQKNIQQLNIKARLLYRKVDQYLLNYMYGEDSGLTAPIMVISEDSATVRVNHPEISLLSR